MVDYSYHAMFVEPVASGCKTHTIRADRKRHARAGEPVGFRTGSRFRPILFGRATCEEIVPISLDLAVGEITLARPSALLLHRLAGGGFGGVRHRGVIPARRIPDLALFEADDRFARADGFSDLDAMKDYWRRHHGTLRFAGWLISWGDSFEITPDGRALRPALALQSRRVSTGAGTRAGDRATVPRAAARASTAGLRRRGRS